MLVIVVHNQMGKEGARRAVGANELTSVNGQTLTYNANGELTNNGAESFTWDAAQRPISVTNTTTGTKTTDTYNGFDERVSTVVQTSGTPPVTTEPLWCGGTICADFDASNTLIAQYFPQGEVDGSQDYLYTRNNVGSVTSLVTPQGTVAGQYQYSPYGQMSVSGSTTSQTPIPAFGYTGMVYDQSTGLNLTLYRAYGPKLRRWLSRDPLGMISGVALIWAGLWYRRPKGISCAVISGVQRPTVTGEWVKRLPLTMLRRLRCHRTADGHYEPPSEPIRLSRCGCDCALSPIR